MMEIQSIYLQAEQDSRILSVQFNDLSRNIDDQSMVDEISDSISEYFPDKVPYDRVVVQYDQNQHMDRPRMLILANGSPSIFYLEDLESRKPIFYSFLSEFKKKIEDYLKKINN